MENVKNILFQSIGNIANQIEQFVYNPEKDFIRHSPLSFRQMLLILLGMGGQTLAQELELQGFKITTSAFVQRRYQIKPEAFYQLFKDFTKQIPNLSAMPILAADGTDMSIPTNPAYSETYFPEQNGQRSYNTIHINALYDLERGIYTDLAIEGKRKVDERQAVIDMMGGSPF